MGTAAVKVRNPRTGLYDYDIVPLDAVAVESSAQHLRGVQPAWADAAPAERATVLAAFANAIEHNADAITSALTIDTGRRAISRIEVIGTIAAIRRWAARGPQVILDHLDTGKNRRTSIPGISTSAFLVPYPLVGVISPWNFPLTLALIDAIPALAAGCAVMVKPSEVTPRFIRPLVDCVPPGLPLAVIEGDGATGAAMIPGVDYIAFTGSVATGRRVAMAAAEAFIPASLELGGKDPMIVLASADPLRAAQTALRASIVNTGQACQSIERVLVAREIAEPFIAALVEVANRVRLNWPDIGTGDIGPFIFEKQAAIVQAQIDEAVTKGAELLTGGRVETLGGGLYLRPTVLTGVTPDMTVLRHETFGPVIPVTVFDTVNDAVAQANAGTFGLSAAVVGDEHEARDVAHRLRAGAVSINDGALTSMIWEAEKSSFGASGMGPSRMGDSGILRFFRRQALIVQAGRPMPLAAFAEDAAR